MLSINYFRAYVWFSNLKASLEDFGLKELKYNDALFYNIMYSLYITIYNDNIKAFCPDDITIFILKKYL